MVWSNESENAMITIPITRHTPTLNHHPIAHTTLPEMWGGLECTVNRVGDRYFDQTILSGHQERLSDLARFAELGIRAIRYMAAARAIRTCSIPASRSASQRTPGLWRSATHGWRTGLPSTSR
jgi:hypothetical protein